MNEQRKSTVQRWTLVLALFALLVIGLAGCRSSSTPTPTVTPTVEPTPTQPPTPTPEPTPTPTLEPPTPTPTPSPPAAPVTDPAGETRVLVGKKISVRASAPDADGYRWELQGDGEISATEGEVILYTAPGSGQVDPGGTMALLVVVAYSQGGNSPATTLVINVPPISVVPVTGNILIKPTGDAVLRPRDCPTPGAQGEVLAEGTITLSGLEPGRTYRLTLNGWRGEPPDDELCKISADRGECYWDFDTSVTANENGAVSQKLQAFLPSDEIELYPNTAYKVKFFVKDGTTYCTVLGKDDFWFKVIELKP